MIYLLDDFDGDQDIVFIEAEQAVWVVEENIGVKYVIFHEFFQRRFETYGDATFSAACARLEADNGPNKESPRASHTNQNQKKAGAHPKGTDD